MRLSIALVLTLNRVGINPIKFANQKPGGLSGECFIRSFTGYETLKWL